MHALLVDAGDFFQGSALGDLYGKENPGSASPRAQGKANAKGLFTSANVWLKVPPSVKWSPSAATSLRALRNVGGVDVATCFFGLTPPQIPPPAFLQAWPEATGVAAGNTRYIVDFSKLPSPAR